MCGRIISASSNGLNLLRAGMALLVPSLGPWKPTNWKLRCKKPYIVHSSPLKDLRPRAAKMSWKLIGYLNESTLETIESMGQESNLQGNVLHSKDWRFSCA